MHLQVPPVSPRWGVVGRSMSTVLQAVVPEHGVSADPLGLAWPGPGAEIDGDTRRGYLDRIIRE